MASKLQCVRTEQGETGGGDCNCPACTMQRVMEGVNRSRAKAEAEARAEARKNAEADAETTKAPPDAPAAPAPVAKPSNSAAVKLEERLRDSVSQYLVDDLAGTRWEDVAGNEEPLKLLRRAIEAPVKHAELYDFYNIKAPRGVLLEGPPGCGKTMMARAAAVAMAEVRGADRPQMLRINGPEIQTPFVGATEKIIREIFAYARAFHGRYGYPLIIFVDEADAILPPRDGMGGRPAQSWESSQVAAFLTEMDGLSSGGAMVLLATNRAHAIDAALLRPGRVDVKVRVERPNRDACVQILAGALKAVPVHAPHTHLKGSVPAGYASPVESDGVALRRALAERAVDFLLSPAHVVTTLQSDVGPLHLTMKHIVSGALLAELGNRCKVQAFERDLSAGTRLGVIEDDATAAVHALVTEAGRGSYPDALNDLCVAAGARIATTAPASMEEDAPGEVPFNAIKPRKDQKLN